MVADTYPLLLRMRTTTTTEAMGAYLIFTSTFNYSILFIQNKKIIFNSFKFTSILFKKHLFFSQTPIAEKQKVGINRLIYPSPSEYIKRKDS